MPQGTVEVCALYDYSPSHTDELSFKKGDILTVLRLLDGGWWEGSLNGMVGWFPSNYVTLVPDAAKKPEVPNCNEPILLHLQSFQDEIVQHILEGEIRHINELTNLVHTFLVNLEPLDNLHFVSSSETKRVGKLFLDFAPTMNSIGCDYSKVHLYVLTGMAKESEAIARHFSSVGMRFQMDRCSQQLCLIFDRLGRYPLLLKEVERYLENPHVDRDDIQKAMNVYSEIAERCAILRKFKEYDIEILLSVINGWQGPSIAHLGDPILTLRVVLTRVEDSPDHPLPNVPTSQPIPNGRRSVLVIFPTCVLLLARTAQPNTYEFMTKLTLNRLTVLRSMDKETDINLITASSSMNSRDSVRHCRFSLTCTDQNARDLLFSTLTDLIHYQTLVEQPSDGRGVRSSVPALSDLTDGCPSSQQKDNKSAGPSDACCDSTNSDETQNAPLTAPRKSTSPQTSSVSHSGSNPHSSLNGGTPASITGFVPPMEATTAAPPTSDVLSSSTQHANAPSTKTDCSLSCRPLPPQLHTELHFLPHQLTTHAHVQSLVALEHRAEENARPLPPGALRCLRLDGPLPMLRSNWPQRVHSSYLHPSGPSPFVPGTQKSDVEIHRAGRPRSPKEDAMKDHRRKKSGLSASYYPPVYCFDSSTVYLAC
ncbi:unnamed protein product [Dicrocoelium dendriticum]|nr:unnamed protein product [Dicrocoelium dendriticum]